MNDQYKYWIGKGGSLLTALLIVAFAASGLSTVYAQSTTDAHGDGVEVTLRFNAATVPDTLREQDVVQVRGQIIDHDWGNETYLGQTIRWNAESSIIAENVGGDYWEATVYVLPGDTLMYKFWTGFSLDPETGTANGGWEADPNRIFGVPEGQTEPMVVDLAFYNHQELFEEKADSVGLFFRVNVGARTQLPQGAFDPENEDHKVGVRGTPEILGNPGDWGATEFYLEKEPVMDNSNNVFYSGVRYIHEDTLANYSEFIYKFVTEAPGTTWEDNISDRAVNISELADSTLQWVFFDDNPPSEDEIVPIDADITFAVNVNVLSNLGIFDDAIDDVGLRGNFNGWGNLGHDMTFSPTLERYQITLDYNDPNLVFVNRDYYYKYFVMWDESREDEGSPNYIPGLQMHMGWEEPGTTGGDNRYYRVTEEPVQQTYPEDQGYSFFNDLAGAAVILSDFIEGQPETLPITFRIDMSRAQTVPDAELQFVPSQDSVFIAFEEQIFAFSQGFGYGSDAVNNASNIERNEKYLLKDENGDGIYEITVDANLPTVNSLGFIIGYGQPNIGEGLIHWNGGGTEYGRRYYQFITPTSVDDFDGVLVSSWPGEAILPVLTWYGGQAFDDEGLSVEVAPDYAAIATSVDDGIAQTPTAYSLEQNYPNPFNPTTKINFTIPESQDVRLDVYNILGQRVATLVNTHMTSGSHTFQLDGSRLASGTYIYRLQAGDFVQQRKMTLIK